MVTAAIAERLVISVTRVPRLFGLEYRLATSAPLPVANPFPAALLGVLAGDYCPIYELHFAPENIIVVGDSGGGILAYQLARYCTSFGLYGSCQDLVRLLTSTRIMCVRGVKSWHSVLSLLGKPPEISQMV
ncbi:hypothetical protein WG66_014781 [Moniliophthora roreri]|nr:hypothetical protein WG66_014781 [Moniliophthora roreri]